MLIIDFSNVAIQTTVMLWRENGGVVTKDLLRGLIIRRLLSFDKQFNTTNKDAILALDSYGNYWRKDVFPLYKANRKKAKKPGEFSYVDYIPMVDELVQEFKENLKFKIVQVDRCEADDIIFVLTRRNSHENFNHNETIIISEDKDLLQAQYEADGRVFQFRPSTREQVTLDNEDGTSLFHHIIGGDSGDGIPNIFSDDDTLITEGKRQKPYTAKMKIRFANVFFNHYPEFRGLFTDVEYERFKRNKTLISLNSIPLELQDKIEEAYANAKSNEIGMFNYLMKHKLTNLISGE